MCTQQYIERRVSVVRCGMSKALDSAFMKSSISEIHVPFCNSYIIVLHISHHQFFIHCVCAFFLFSEHGPGQCFNSFCHFYLNQTCKHNSFCFILFFFLLLYYDHFSLFSIAVVAMLHIHFNCITLYALAPVYVRILKIRKV